MWWLPWLAGLATAQVEVCPGVYDNDQLLVDLDAIDATLGELDIDAARDQMKHVHRMVLCLESPVDPLGVARFGRQLSLAFFFDQDEAAMKRWARLTRSIAPDLPWHADLAPEHPYREAVDALDDPGEAGPEASLIVPKKAVLYRNGVAITEPVAPIEVPGLVQLDEKGEWRIWWQDGSAFPEDLLTDPGSPLELPKNYAAPTGNPVHAEHAGRPLFGEAEVEIPDEPPPELVADAAEIEAAKEDDGGYLDPFAEARKRAIRRQYYETVETNEAGDTITRKTEVLTFAPEDRSGGAPVTTEIFEHWLSEHPDWMPKSAVDAGNADDTYLAGWSDGRPPPNTARSPVANVTWAAAAAYCASFDKTLPSEGSDAPLGWEWVAGDAPARMNAKGKRKVEKKPLSGRSDTSFRCVE